MIHLRKKVNQYIYYIIIKHCVFVFYNINLYLALSLLLIFLQESFLSESLRMLASVTFHVRWTMAMYLAPVDGEIRRILVILIQLLAAQNIMFYPRSQCDCRFHRIQTILTNCGCPHLAYGRKLNLNTSLCLNNRALVHSKFFYGISSDVYIFEY